jgi:ankyrin repeat protein
MEYLSILKYIKRGATYQALVSASKEGYLEIVRRLVSQRSNHRLNEAARSAAVRGQLDVIQFLVHENPSLLQDTIILELAAQHCHVEVVKFLLTEGVDLGNSLRLATRGGSLEIVQLLLQRDPSRNFTLREALVSGHLQVVKFLLDSGFEIGHSLLVAAQVNQVEIAKLLIDRGAEVNQSVNNRTPLCLAAERGYFEMVKLLIDRGVDFLVPDNGEAMMGALLSGHSDIASYILKHERHLS